MSPAAAASIQLDVESSTAVLRLCRPDQLNAFTAEMHVAARSALDRIEANPDLRALIVTGEGRAFCAGADLRERVETLDRVGEVDLHKSLIENYNPLIRRISALPIPVISAVNGMAAGAGVGLALAADVVIAGRSAEFQLSFAKVGLALDAGLSWTLPRLIGAGRALAMALTAETISAETAHAWGLIWRVVDDDMVMAESRALAAKFAAMSRGALVAIKRQLRHTPPISLEEALKREADSQGQLGKSADYTDAIRAFTRRKT